MVILRRVRNRTALFWFPHPHLDHTQMLPIAALRLPPGDRDDYIPLVDPTPRSSAEPLLPVTVVFYGREPFG